MIVGTVNTDFEAIISVGILGIEGQWKDFQAVVDTGFNRDLTLPSDTITENGLELVGRRRVVLADGSEQLTDVYEASIDWDGQTRGNPSRVSRDSASCRHGVDGRIRPAH